MCTDFSYTHTHRQNPQTHIDTQRSLFLINPRFRYTMLSLFRSIHQIHPGKFHSLLQNVNNKMFKQNVSNLHSSLHVLSNRLRHMKTIYKINAHLIWCRSQNISLKTPPTYRNIQSLLTHIHTLAGLDRKMSATVGRHTHLLVHGGSTGTIFGGQEGEKSWVRIMTSHTSPRRRPCERNEDRGTPTKPRLVHFHYIRFALGEPRTNSGPTIC